MTILAAWVLWAHTDSIDLLIERLGSEEIDVRDKASASLRQLGDRAVPALRRALKSPDAEIRGRARDVLASEGIQVVALQGTDPADLAQLLHDLFQGDPTVDVTYDQATRSVFFRGQDGFLKVAREIVDRIDQDAVENAGRLERSPGAEVVFQDSRATRVKARVEK